MKRILIQFAHPKAHKSRINSALLNAVSGLSNVTIRHLYELYPDFFIDVKTEQKVLTEHDIIVFQHPFYWYSAPSILKEWIDLVFEHGWAYGKEGAALQGKKLLTATSTGGSAEAYTPGGNNHTTINEFLSPFRQTAELCKMTYLPPFVVFGSLLLSQEDLQKSASDYKQVILALRDEQWEDGMLKKHKCINDLLSKKAK